jgi:hypothetical protein
MARATRATGWFETEIFIALLKRMEEGVYQQIKGQWFG